ncbi:MAG: hypothetical protein U9O90_10270 [Euryarchaeota archaeon]|nr:hypothetical protein [Euryarchaeota archaeon]
MVQHQDPIDWSKVKEAHVKDACSRYDSGDRRPKVAAKNTFLLLGDKRYPAKFIRGLAYEIATGHKLGSDDYSGGAETVRFFTALGFSVEYNREVRVKKKIHESDRNSTVIITNTNTKGEHTPSRTKKSIILQKRLEQRFGCVMTEAKFDWLVVPDYSSMDDIFRDIYDNLKAMRNYSGFSNPGYKLACDFFIPSKNLIIEYDERQHFTEQRAESLAHYPSNLNLSFDKDKWREACANIKATDNDPLYRDEQRAFYDSVRDILAARNGIPLIRIKHGDYDWKSASGTDVIDELIKHLNLDTHASDLETAIEELAWDFSCVQKAYHDWAKQFKNHEDVIRWLKEKGIDGSRCQKQHSFTLHSSNWNPITLSILYALIPDCMAQMKDRFDKIVQYTSEPKNHLSWYLLYFIHPVRHELYYFGIHYPDGYSARLASLIRVHRLGLKGAKTYLSKEGRTTADSYIRACGTTAFKHLHLHPTTSALEKPNHNDLNDSILHLEIGGANLSCNEQEIAISLSAKATMNFERWIGYAPCAINEGPIFTLKRNKKHSDCFNDILDILKDPNQKAIRTKLEEYYTIKVIRDK